MSANARRQETTTDRFLDAAFTAVATSLDRAAMWMNRCPWVPGKWDYTKINVLGLIALLLILAASIALNVALIWVLTAPL